MRFYPSAFIRLLRMSQAVVNWLQNDSVSIVSQEDIPSEAKFECAVTTVKWGRTSLPARVVKISGK